MTRFAFLRVLCLCAVLPALAGCGAITALGEAAEPSAVFELSTPADLPTVPGRPRPIDVIVEQPTTGGALETDRIMIRPGPLEAQYLPDVRWANATPLMMQTLMLRTLDATGAFQYVGRRPLGPSGDFAIVTELVDFHAALDPDGDSAQVTVRMIARLVRENGVRIVATDSFAATATAASLDDADIVAAFDTATGQILSRFAGWTLAALGIR
jgi:cholesterol transport system auxiliary component